MLRYFPRALEAVTVISEYGARKYEADGWRRVPDGFTRYTDALLRHLRAEGQGQALDPESSRLHAEHVAWNALARLELLLTTLAPEPPPRVSPGNVVQLRADNSSSPMLNAALGCLHGSFESADGAPKYMYGNFDVESEQPRQK